MTSPAALKHVVLDLTERMNGLIDELEAVAQQLEAIEPPFRPFRYTPPGAERGMGEIALTCRPGKPLSRERYWTLYGQQIQKLLDREDDRKHWLRQVSNADSSLPSMTPDSVGQIIVRSDWIAERSGAVPDMIYPENFSYDFEAASCDEDCFEAFFNRAFPEAE